MQGRINCISQAPPHQWCPADVKGYAADRLIHKYKPYTWGKWEVHLHPYQPLFLTCVFMQSGYPSNYASAELKKVFSSLMTTSAKQHPQIGNHSETCSVLLSMSLMHSATLDLKLGIWKHSMLDLLVPVQNMVPLIKSTNPIYNKIAYISKAILTKMHALDTKSCYLGKVLFTKHVFFLMFGCVF